MTEVICHVLSELRSHGGTQLQLLITDRTCFEGVLTDYELPFSLLVPPVLLTPVTGFPEVEVVLERTDAGCCLVFFRNYSRVITRLKARNFTRDEVEDAALSEIMNRSLVVEGPGCEAPDM